MADGIYDYPDQIFTANDQDRRVRVVGDPEHPDRVVLRFTGAAGRNLSGFAAVDGGRIGWIDGLTLVAVGAQAGGGTWRPQSFGSGVYARGAGSAVWLGPHVVIQGFYYGVTADQGAYVNAPDGGVVVRDAGDVGLMARFNGVIHCERCRASGAVDRTPGGDPLGCNFTAEAGGALFIDRSSGDGSLIGAVCGLSGGRIWAHGFEGRGGLGGGGAGAFVVENAYAELTGARFAGYGTGIYAGSGGGALVDRVEVTASSGDGLVADGGALDGSGASSSGGGGFGVHVFHQGRAHLFGSLGRLRANRAGATAVEPAGGAGPSLYQGSSLVITP